MYLTEKEREETLYKDLPQLMASFPELSIPELSMLYVEIKDFQERGASVVVERDLDGPPKILPIFKNDTMETLLDRWANLFPNELKATKAEWKEVAGNSHADTMMGMAKIPSSFYYACQSLYPGFWDVKNDNVRKFRKLAPTMGRKV